VTGPAIDTDLQNRSLRPLSDQESAVGGVMLEDAWGILTARISNLGARVVATPIDAALRGLVVQIQVAMVLRVLNNPYGMMTEGADDSSMRRDSAVSTGALYVSDSEADLLSAGDSVSEGAFTIRPKGWRTDPQPDPWTTVSGASVF